MNQRTNQREDAEVDDKVEDADLFLFTLFFICEISCIYME